MILCYVCISELYPKHVCPMGHFKLEGLVCKLDSQCPGDAVCSNYECCHPHKLKEVIPPHQPKPPRLSPLPPSKMPPLRPNTPPLLRIPTNQPLPPRLPPTPVVPTTLPPFLPTVKTPPINVIPPSQFPPTFPPRIIRPPSIVDFGR